MHLLRLIVVGFICFGLVQSELTAETFTGFSLPGINSPDAGVYEIQNGTIAVPLSSIRFGIPENEGDFSNELILAGLPYSAPINEPFIIAYASYYNGVTQLGSNPSTFNVTFDLTIENIGGKTFRFEFPFELTLTPNTTGDPILDADTLTPINTQQTEFFTFNGVPYALELQGFVVPALGDDVVSEFVLIEDTATFAQFWGSIGVVAGVGDVNCDGSVNLLDVAPFVDLISSGGFDAKADINQDGSVDLLDVQPFVTILTNCP